MCSHFVHDKLRLSNTNRFDYLISLVYKAAEEAIAGIKITQSCYSNGLYVPKNCFGNVKLIEQKYLENLRMLRPADSFSKVTSLRNVYDTVQMN